MRLAMLVWCGAVVLLLTGCDLLDKNPSEVKARVGRLQSAVGSSDWKSVEGMIGSGFAWTDANGKARTGKTAFVNSLKAGGGGGATLAVNKVIRISDDTYLTLIDAKVGSMTWSLRLSWQKQTGGWMISAAKDLSARQGMQAPATAGQPTSAGGQMAKEAGEAVDYAIGYTQLKAKKKVKEQVNDLNDKHNTQLEDALK